MFNLAGTLLLVGFGSFILPLMGYQFTIVTALGDGGGLICILAGVGLGGFALFRQNSKIKNGVPLVNVSKLKLENKGLDESVFVKFQLLALCHGGNNLQTLNTLKAIFLQVFGDQGRIQLIDDLANTIEDWTASFIENMGQTKDSLSDEQKEIIIKCQFALAFGDGETTDDELSFLFTIAEKLGVSQERALEYLKQTKETLVAA